VNLTFQRLDQSNELQFLAGGSSGVGGGSGGGGVAAVAAPIAPLDLLFDSLVALVTTSVSVHLLFLSLCILIESACLCRVVNGRRWWVVCTWCCIIQWGLNSEHGGIHNLVCANLVVVLLTMLSEGSRR
jgi:hypothetical protein